MMFSVPALVGLLVGILLLCSAFAGFGYWFGHRVGWDQGNAWGSTRRQAVPWKTLIEFSVNLFGEENVAWTANRELFEGCHATLTRIAIELPAQYGVLKMAQLSGEVFDPAQVVELQDVPPIGQGKVSSVVKILNNLGWTVVYANPEEGTWHLWPRLSHKFKPADAQEAESEEE